MNKEFNKGLFLAGFGSFWWGFFGVLYFKYITFIGHIELVVHRCLWTTFTLVITTFLFSKWDIFFTTIKSKKNLLYLFFDYCSVQFHIRILIIYIFLLLHCSMPNTQIQQRNGATTSLFNAKYANPTEK